MGLNGTRSGRGGAGLGQNHQVGIGLGKDMDLRVPSQQVWTGLITWESLCEQTESQSDSTGNITFLHTTHAGGKYCWITCPEIVVFLWLNTVLQKPTSTDRFVLPILCEILASDYCSNGKMLKFDKEITKGQMLKYVIMNCSCEFLVTQ